MTPPSILKVAAYVAAIGAISGGAVGAWTLADQLNIRPVLKGEFLEMAQTQADVVEQLQKTQQQSLESMNWEKFMRLMSQSKVAALPAEEKRQLCELATQFKMTHDAGC